MREVKRKELLAEVLRDAFENTHPTEHVAFEDPDAPVYGQISGWFDLRVIAESVLTDSRIRVKRGVECRARQ